MPLQNQRNTGHFTFPTLTKLRALSGENLDAGDPVFYSPSTDQATESKKYSWNATSTATDDGDLVIKLTDTITGRLLRADGVYNQGGTGAINQRSEKRLRNELWVTDFGATGDGVTDDTAAIELAISAASLAATDGRAQVVRFPEGTYSTSSMITQPNRVTFKGENARATLMKAIGGFSGSWMINAVNGTSSMFDARIEGMFIDCNNVSGLGGILSDAWQENSGTKNVVIAYFRTSGIKFQNGYGGAAMCSVEHTEIFGSALGATYGIDVQQISAVGGFILHTSDTTIAGGIATLDYDAETGTFTTGLILTGGTSGATATIAALVDNGTTGTLSLTNVTGTFVNDEIITDSSTGSATADGGASSSNLTAAINIVNDSTAMVSTHFENCDNGVYINGVGSHTLINVTGASTVTDVVELDASFVGSINMLGNKRRGATNLYNNKVDGSVLTGAVADPAIYTFPISPYTVVPLFTDGEKAPDISTNTGWRTNNTSGTVISGLRGGASSGIVTILFGDSNTTFFGHTLDYDAETSPFTEGLVLTGGTSGATANIDHLEDNGTTGTMTLGNVSGTFTDGETITDSSTGSADADGASFTNFNIKETFVSMAGATMQFFNSAGVWYELTQKTHNQTYTPTNVSTVRSFDASTISAADLADVVGTLIEDLQARAAIK